MITKPCIVCDFPVEIADAEERVYFDKEKMARDPDISVNVITVCGSKRCQRLVNEVIAESGKELQKGETDEG